jgi:hypothetical protein
MKMRATGSADRMETEQQRDAEQQTPPDDQSVEDFRREVEDDPSTAPADDENLERERGG